VRVERRVLPVTADEDRRIEVFERELWRIAVEHLPYGEQIQWAALAGARVAPSGWRRARAMLHFDRGGEFKRAFLLTAVQRNRNPQLRVRALQEIAASRDGEAFDTAIDVIGTWTREERREGTKVMLLALAEKRIGRRDQANAWIWRLASYTREVHEEYAVQRWPETKRLLGLLVNSSGAAHARNARRLVHAARKQDRRLSAALLAAAIAHTPEGEEILRGARTRLARKPSALSRELLRNFPKSRGRRGSRRRRKKGGVAEGADGALQTIVATSPPQSGADIEAYSPELDNAPTERPAGPTRQRSRRSRIGRGAQRNTDPAREAAPQDGAVPAPSRRSRSRPRRKKPEPVVDDAVAVEAIADAAAALMAARGAPQEALAQEPPAEEQEAKPKRRRAPARQAAGATTPAAEGDAPDLEATPSAEADTPDIAATASAEDAPAAAPLEEAKPKRRRASVAKAAAAEDAPEAASLEEPKPRRRRAPAPAAAVEEAPEAAPLEEAKPKRRRASVAKAAAVEEASEAAPLEEAKPKRRRASVAKAAATEDAPEAASLEEAKPKRRRAPTRRPSAKSAGDDAPDAASLDDGVESAA
jgi:chemotaxis protein histidine kinase CheA